VLEKFTEAPSVDECKVALSDHNIAKNRFSTLRLLSRDSDMPLLTGGEGRAANILRFRISQTFREFFISEGFSRTLKKILRNLKAESFLQRLFLYISAYRGLSVCVCLSYLFHIRALA